MSIPRIFLHPFHSVLEGWSVVWVFFLKHLYPPMTFCCRHKDSFLTVKSAQFWSQLTYLLVMASSSCSQNLPKQVLRQQSKLSFTLRMIQLLSTVQKGQLMTPAWAATPPDGSFPMSVLFFVVYYYIFLLLQAIANQLKSSSSSLLIPPLCDATASQLQPGTKDLYCTAGVVRKDITVST